MSRADPIFRVLPATDGNAKSRTALGCGNLAAPEPDGYSHAAAVVTRESCLSMAPDEPCGAWTHEYDIYGPSGKLVLSRRVEHASAEPVSLLTAAARFVVVCDNRINHTSIDCHVIDPMQGRSFDWEELGAEPEVFMDRLIGVEYEPSLQTPVEKITMRCLDLETFLEYHLQPPKLSKPAKDVSGPHIRSLGPGRLWVTYSSGIDGAVVGEGEVRCPPLSPKNISP